MRIPLALLGVAGLVAGCNRVWGLGDDAADTDAGTDAGPPPYVEAVLADTPLGYWRFSADAGPLAIDSAGSHNGVYSGGATPTAPGAIGSDRAVALDGVDDFVDMGDSAGFAFEGLRPFTLEAWVYAEPTAGRTAILARESGALPAGWVLFAQGGRVGFTRFDGTQSQSVETDGLSPMTWTHVVVVYSVPGLGLYLDGQLRMGTPGPEFVAPTTTTLFVVGAQTGGTVGNFRGAIDEVAIYGRALPSERILAHHTFAARP